MTPETFQEVADRVTEPMLLLAGSGSVVACNQPAHRALGVAVGDSLPQRAEDPEQVSRFLVLASRSTQPLPGALRLRDDGGERWRCDACLVGEAEAAGPLVFVHLRSGSRAATRFAALNRQIEQLHEEIRRRQALEVEREALLAGERQARREAQEANRLKDEFLAAVSHELRTPLNAITGWLSLLRESPSPDLFQRALDVFDRNVAAQVQLTEDLVDVSRVITGRMRLDLQPIDLATVVRQAIDSALPAAESKNLRLELIADPGGCTINADPDRILQVVWNLLSNATRFTPKGGKIQVVLRRVNSHVEIVVSDTGLGIPAEVLPYVFDRFRQADGSTTRRHGGLGLGLAIVRHLVELHGGVVMAHSDGPGKGATFTVNLPMPIFERQPAVPPGGEAQEALRRSDAASSSDCLSGCRVLLVEDHDDSRDLLERILCASGADVYPVASAEGALAAWETREFDAVISDIEMPGEDGFTLMRKLRDRERQRGVRPTPGIAVTAHSIGDARIHALRAGYHTFLVKPIHPPELVALVESLCGMSRR